MDKVRILRFQCITAAHDERMVVKEYDILFLVLKETHSNRIYHRIDLGPGVDEDEETTEELRAAAPEQIPLEGDEDLSGVEEVD
ncbi:Heat shock protein HSP 90-beta [Tupaia chinensis]|uniref:Heat shock protein HSP 90-beta n=1 Tax=Tupaia chinensis TaxID=246437 RepID=L9L5N2_TUPCH|nr:Heat shock protein HSP 90-beta [Tupaia chinensis]